MQILLKTIFLFGFIGLYPQSNLYGQQLIPCGTFQCTQGYVCCVSSSNPSCGGCCSPGETCLGADCSSYFSQGSDGKTKKLKSSHQQSHSAQKKESPKGCQLSQACNACVTNCNDYDTQNVCNCFPMCGNQCTPADYQCQGCTQQLKKKKKKTQSIQQ